MSVFSGTRVGVVAVGVVLYFTQVAIAGDVPSAELCQRRLHRAARNLEIAALKERVECHSQRLAGLISAETNCNDSAYATDASAAARRRLTRAAQTCDATALDAVPYLACPAPCETLAIGDFSDVATCLACVTADAAQHVVATIHGAVPAPASAAVQQCQRRLARAAIRYRLQRSTAQLTCRRAESPPGSAGCLGEAIDATLTEARATLDDAVAGCTNDTLQELDGCGASVALEQECVRQAVDTASDIVHNAVLPIPDAPVSASSCSAGDNPFADCWPTSGMTIGLPYLRLVSGRDDSRFSLESFCAAGYLNANDDALPDLVCTSLEHGVRVYENRGQFRFAEVTTRVGLGSLRTGSRLMSLSWADLDGDGQQDLIGAELPSTFAADLRDAYLFGLPFRSMFDVTLRVFRNQDGTFHDVTRAWGFGPHHYPSFPLYSSKVADLNGDGKLDVAFKQLAVRGAVPPLLFVSQPDGTWKESASDYFGSDVTGNAFALGWTDIDLNGAPDFMLINSAYMNPPMFLLRRTGTSFTQEPIGPLLSRATAMGATAMDLDGDGLMELLVTDIGRNAFLKRSPQEGTWTDLSEQMGLSNLTNVTGDPTSGAAVAFTATFIPLEGQLGALFTAGTDGSNVGKPYIKLFTVEADRFVERSELVANLAQHNGEGVAQADYDGDGCPDLLIAGHSWFDPAAAEWDDDEPLLLWNRSSPGQCLSLGFRTTSANPFAIGTLVTVESGDTKRTQALYGLGSQNGDDEPRVFFPVAAAEAAKVHVRWPDGATQDLELMPGRHTLHQP